MFFGRIKVRTARNKNNNNDNRTYNGGKNMGKEIAVFGAGNYGKRAIMSYLNEGEKVACVVDNASEKWGGNVLDIPIISPAEFYGEKDRYHIVIAVNVSFQKQIELQLQDMGVEDYEIFDLKKYSEKERLISYSERETLEDVILYHVLKEEKDIFYIDVGSNDPFEHSVTKLLYDIKNAKGINIEPQRGFCELTQKERPRDINLCLGVGAQRGKEKFYFQGGFSTFIKENVVDENGYYEMIDIVTLKDICDEYVQGGAISFLKIDVEGAEYDVLVGADFKEYRPWIIIIESTEPGTDIPCYHKWEEILLSNQYHFVLAEGVNRYYVADERKMLDERFCSIDKLAQMYNIYHACFRI